MVSLADYLIADSIERYKADIIDGSSVEAIFDASELETFTSPTALGSTQPRRGAGFWVTADDLAACADALERGGHLRGLVDRGS